MADPSATPLPVVAQDPVARQPDPGEKSAQAPLELAGAGVEPGKTYPDRSSIRDGRDRALAAYAKVRNA
jgi:hypothetical protein